MSLTVTNPRYGVSAKGKRTWTANMAFSDTSAYDVLATTSGLRRVDEIHVLCPTSSAAGVNVTANTEGTKVTLQATAALTADLVFTGYE